MSYNQSMIEKMLRVSRLVDCYGPLLTDRQRKCIEMHYLQDLSLGEIAAELEVSRQAVNDILRRTEEAMEQYESKLNLLVQEKARAELLLQVRDWLKEARDSGHPAGEPLRLAIDAVEQILKQEMGY